MARTKGGNVRRASSAPLIGENEKGKPVPLQTIPAQSLPREPPTKSEDLGLPWKDDTLNGDTSSKPRSADHDMSASPTNVETASRRRTRAGTAALKTKRESAGLNDEQDKSDDLKESEGERKAKEKQKGKRPCLGKQKIDKETKRRKGVNINEPTQEKGKYWFKIDEEESEDEDTTFLVKRKSKGKMKIDDDGNRINNRRMAKGIADVSTEGVIFNSEENEASKSKGPDVQVQPSDDE
ncbi:hypothetical protein LIER_35021 [Lithospermum erythrorhizon]|uniref:Uncharacterized protein n=1 Tax=Lithospermum erythrorhizon TaxID=34254 RepID=A0AAV3NJQ0_LITER